MTIEKLAIKDKSLSRKLKLIKDLKNKNCNTEKIDSLEHDLMRNINLKKLKKSLLVDISQIRKQLKNDEMLILLAQDDYDSIYAICQTRANPPQRILVSNVLAEDL